MKRTIVIFITLFDVDSLKVIPENYKTKWYIQEEKLKLNYTLYHKISSEINLLLLEYNND